MKLNNSLKLLRLQKDNLSQQQLADMVGCSRQTIFAIESGSKKPSIEIALKLSLVFEMPVENIFQLEEGKEKQKFCQRIREIFNNCPFKRTK